MPKYLIIGSGAAGISAVEGIRNADPNGEISLLCEEPAGYYSRPGLAYFLTGEITEACLSPFQGPDFTKLKVHQIRAKAVRIFPQEHRVSLSDGLSLEYNKLLIATGAEASKTKVPGLDLDGVLKLDNLEDARRILKFAHRRRKAVVVGGGITALELVEGFRARGVKVHYFLRGDRYWSNVLDETESRIVEHRLTEEGITLHYQTEMAEILGKHGRVNGVLTSEGKKIDCDFVGVAIGIQPKKMLAETAGLKTDRGISVDQYLNTSAADIFAAGDVAQVYDPSVGKAILDSLWNPACSQGNIAGLNMAGKKVAYQKGVPFNVTRLAGLTTTIIGSIGTREDNADVVGILRGESEAWHEMPDAIAAQSHFNVNRLRVLLGENKILGALLMGDQTLSRALKYMVGEKIDISNIREKMLDQGISISDVITDFWREISTAGENAANLPIKS